MTLWIIEPRDSLIVRDGRPFGAVPGARAHSLDFPFPSTVAGGARTRAGLTGGVFDKGLIEEVRNIEVRGPLLAELDSRGGIADWLCPAPADALLVGASEEGDASPPAENAARLVKLRPIDPGPGLTNLDAAGVGLLPVGTAAPLKGKPYADAPRYWRWSFFSKWLADDELGAGGGGTRLTPSELGHDGPVKETRTHVRVERATQTASEGALFQTTGLEFRRRARGAGRGAFTRMGLALWVEDAGRGGEIAEGPAPLAGERRLVEWRKGGGAFPSCPPAVRDRVMEDKACRVILLTPAHFEAGSTPGRLREASGDVQPTLRAAASGRAQVVSGWDFELNRPKPTRRLVPAGATYFFSLEGEKDKINSWLDAVWMRCVSDGDADRRDGFGLAVVGAWDGHPLNLE